MTATPVILQSGAQLPGGSAAPLMVPVTTFTQITSAVFSNSNNVQELVTLYVVRGAGDPGPLNQMAGITLPPFPNPAYVSPELRGMYLDVGDALYGFAADGGVVTVIINGVQFG